VLPDVAIPDYITVHLGHPDSAAKNARVKFIDYIKNVGSSEIYPTWPQASLEANICLSIDGIIGPATWKRIVAEYIKITT
jgi:hypothetical protein